MDKPEPITGLSDDERMLLGEALRALRRKRGATWNAACDAAEARGKRRPSLRAYGIEAIRRLARAARRRSDALDGGVMSQGPGSSGMMSG